MARILYGVMGDRPGHMVRSMAVAQSMPHHQFLFVGGGWTREMSAWGYPVEPAPMASTLYAGSRVDLPGTFLNAMRVFRSRGAAIRKTAAIIRDFDPDLILSDYEYFTPLAARRAGRTCVSLDHQHILTHCLYPHPKGQS